MARALAPVPDHIPVGPDLPPPVAAAVRLAIAGSAPGADLSLRCHLFSATRKALGGPPPDIASVRDETIQGPGGPLRLRLYRPSFGHRSLPALLYLHGGSWQFGDLESHDTVCRKLAVASGHAILAVDYRLAPEHPFPAALEDGWAALSWLVKHAPLLAIDPVAIGVAGDSAGGNLAAVLALRARDEGGPNLKAQVLIYPATDLVATSASHLARAEGYLLDRPGWVGAIEAYLGGRTGVLDPRVSPLRALDHAGLPPTVIVTAGFDPLLDEGRAYAARLAAAGVPVFHRTYPDMVHGFITMGGQLPAADEAIADLGRGLAAYDIFGLIDGAGI